jgi:hypothetical protein
LGGPEANENFIKEEYKNTDITALWQRIDTPGAEFSPSCFLLFIIIVWEYNINPTDSNTLSIM